MSKLTRSQHCALSWALLLLLLVALGVAVLLPWYRQIVLYDESMATLRERIQQFQEKVNSRSALEAELQNPGYDERVRNGYLRGSTGAVAGAELQRKVKSVVESTEGQLLSTQLLLPSAQDARVAKVAVKVRMRGNTEDLLNTLYAIETSRPVLLIEDIAVRGPKQGRGRPAQTALDISLTLAGYMQNRQPQP